MSRRTRRKLEERRWAELQRLIQEQRADDGSAVHVPAVATRPKPRRAIKRRNGTKVYVPQGRVFPSKRLPPVDRKLHGLPPEALEEIERLRQERIARRTLR